MFQYLFYIGKSKILLEITDNLWSN